MLLFNNYSQIGGDKYERKVISLTDLLIVEIKINVVFFISNYYPHKVISHDYLLLNVEKNW